MTPKHAREAASVRFSVYRSMQEKRLPYIQTSDFFKKFLMLYSVNSHNVDTKYAYNETIVNIIITSVLSDTP